MIDTIISPRVITHYDLPSTSTYDHDTSSDDDNSRKQDDKVTHEPYQTSSSSDLVWKRNISLGSQILHHDRYKSFRTRRSTNQQNNSKKRKKNVCGICLFSRDGRKILLVKQREAQKWGFPKGSKETNESKFICMQRELAEETGINLKDYPHTVLNEYTKFQCNLFFVQLHIDEKVIKLAPKDTTEIEISTWINLNDISTLSLNRITKDTLHNLLLKYTVDDLYKLKLNK